MRGSATRVVAVALLAAALAAAGCGAERVPPPGPDPDLRAAALPAAAAQDRELAFQRRVEPYVLRVRAFGCGRVWTGSGFALSRNLFITNRHVVAGAEELQADTFDGRTLKVRRALAAPRPYADLALAYVDGRLPKAARVGPLARPGQSIFALGFPLGEEFTFSPGEVFDYVKAPDGIRGSAFRIDAFVTHGNSGGPVVDARGRVVGVVYRLDEHHPDLRMAVPIPALRAVRKLLVPARNVPCE